MGLVDGDQRQGRTRREIAKARVAETFGRDVHHVIGAVERALHHHALSARAQRRVQKRTAHARFEKRADLIAHKRHQRRHDEGKPGQDDAGDLIAHRLARAGRHDAERIATRQNRFDEDALAGPEVIVTEMTLEGTACLVHEGAAR